MNSAVKIVLMIIGTLFLGIFLWKNTATGGGDSGSTTKKNLKEERQFWDYMTTADKNRLNGNYIDAEEFYVKAVDIKEDHPGALYYLGSVQLILKDFESARRNWQTILEKDPTIARAWLQLGKLYFCRVEANSFYNLAEAEKHFQEAAALSRENTGPPLQIAKIEILKGNHQSAKEYLDAIVAQNFKSYEGFFLKGYVEWKTGLKETALQTLGKAADTYFNSNHQKIQGEGATKSGSNPMLSEALYCDFIKISIKKYLSELNENHPSINIYQDLDEKINEFSIHR